VDARRVHQLLERLRDLVEDDGGTIEDRAWSVILLNDTRRRFDKGGEALLRSEFLRCTN